MIRFVQMFLHPIMSTRALIFVFVLTALLNGKSLMAQSSAFTNADRATFIMDIARYVTWKNSKKIDIYRIGILDRDSAFFNDFTSATEGRTIQEKPINYQLFNRIIDIEGVEILFLNRNSGFDIDLVYQQVKGKQVLLLSENYPFHKSMINFIVVDGKKRFEFNQARMDAEGFKVTVTFAALAVKSELDWHKIYTETERELFEQKEKVTALNRLIEQQQSQIEQQMAILNDLLGEINTQKNRLMLYVEEIELLEGEIETQKTTSQQLLAGIRQKQLILDTQEENLKRMTAEVAAKETENERQQKILDAQTSSISEQGFRIEAQRELLSEQLEKLHQQSIIINLAVALIILFVILVYYIYRSYRIKKQSIKRLEEKNKVIKEQKLMVEQEKEKSDTLLLNILPFKVAEDLKLKGFTEPEEFMEATVFFSDFVGFTEISSKLSPKVVIAELNDLYTTFDNIMQEHGCERIKTIGDAYMAVCGMPVLNKAHAFRMADAALSIVNHIKERNLSSNITWNIRIGMHSGKVVGGIVGVKKFIYDIFGDTINVAARMETNSLPMRVNISDTTHAIIKEAYTFEKREPVDVKGKGLMNMYFILDKKEF